MALLLQEPREGNLLGACVTSCNSVVLKVFRVSILIRELFIASKSFFS